MGDGGNHKDLAATVQHAACRKRNCAGHSTLKLCRVEWQGPPACAPEWRGKAGAQQRSSEGRQAREPASPMPHPPSPQTQRSTTSAGTTI